MSTTKTAFFSSLVLGTFTLGSWQSVRYFDKIALVESQTLALGDTLSAKEIEALDPRIVRRKVIAGSYVHENEVLLGPRGPPPGALALNGPQSGRGGGLASSPQGYYVITPMVLNDGSTVAVNRGWIPKGTMRDDPLFRKPTGSVTLDVVSGNFEEGGTFSPPPIAATMAPSKNKNAPPPTSDHAQTLLWLQSQAFQTLSQNPSPTAPLLFKEILLDSNQMQKTMPVRPSVTQAVEFKVSPEMHLGYAFTWFALSLAGVAMTRQLVRKVVVKKRM